MFKEIVCSLIDILNSSFTIALIGSLAGAFGGAVAAQNVIEKSKRKEIFLKELRNTNAAIMVSFSICNIMLSLKRQHTLPLYEKYISDLEKVEDFNKRRALKELNPGEIFELEADFKTFSSSSIPIDTLKDLLFNKISSYGRSLSAVASLEGTYNSLNEMLLKREYLANKFRSEIKEEEIVYYYFGLTMPSGNTDQEYHDVIEGIHQYVDDVIFFSSLICKDLIVYGNKLREKEKKFAKSAPKVNRAEFDTVKASGLMPQDSNYQDWLDGFKEEGSG